MQRSLLSTRGSTSILSFPNSRVRNKKLQWVFFAQMRQKVLESGVIDAYVSERPEAITAESANSKFKMIQFKKDLKLGKKMRLSLSGWRRVTLELTKSMPH